MSDRVIHIAVVGDSFVGKTSLIKSCFGEEFSEVRIPALFEHEAFELKTSDKSHKIKLIDTVKASITDYSGVDLIILCFSIENRISYRNIKTKWIEELKLLPNWPIPVVLVATKVDLRQEFPEVFLITSEDGQNLSQEINAAKFFEISSKNNVNVSQLIEQSVRILYPNEPKIEEKVQVFQESRNVQNNQRQQGQQQPIKMEKHSSCICC